MASVGGSISSYIGGKAAAVIAVVALAAGAFVIPAVTGGGGGITCSVNAATDAAFDSAVAGATSGQTVCMSANVAYSTNGNGSNTPLTIAAANGVNPTLTASLGSGDSGLVIDGNRPTWDDTTGLRILSVVITGTPGPNVTIKNSLVQESGENGPGDIYIDGPTTARIVIQHNRFTGAGLTDDNSNGSGTEAAIRQDSGNNTLITENLFHDQYADAIKYLGSGSAVTRNKFMNISDFAPWCPDGSCIHSDALQGADSGTQITGNWIDTCQQGLTNFDTSGTSPSGSPDIEHNVIQGCPGHSITLMFSASPGFTAAYNTIVDGATLDCSTSATKNAQYPGAPGGTPTLYNNYLGSGLTLASGGVNCVPARNDHNPTSSPAYAGGATPSSFTSMADFCQPGDTRSDTSGEVGVCGDGFNTVTGGPPVGEGF